MSHVTWPIIMHGFAKCSTETPYFDNVLDAQLVNYTLIVVTQENILSEHYWVKLGHLSLSTSGTLTNKVRTAQLTLKGGIKN